MTTTALTAMGVFALVQAIIFKAPLTRVKVEMEAVAPSAIATAVAVFARTAGAAWTEFSEMASVRAAAGKAMPRRVKKIRSFSTARLTRILTASSLVPRV